MEKYKGLTMPCRQKFPVVNFRKLCAYYCKNEEKWYNVSKIKLIVAGTAAKQSAQKREWYDDCKRYSQRSGCYQYYS